MSDIAAHPQMVRRSPIIESILRAPGAFYLLSIMGVMLTFWTPGFFTAANLTNVALQVAVLTIVALGMTLIILTEGIDLSLGPVLTALASFIMTARMNAAHPTIGVGLEFDAIAAVILGGTSFEKGRGGIAGTVVGALAVGVLRNGLNLIGVGTEWQVAVVGIVIITAVGLDSLRGLNA
jgi:ribose/xylose/arabinose/galactoside ABC-type transport system permease subunit